MAKKRASSRKQTAGKAPAVRRGFLWFVGSLTLAGLLSLTLGYIYATTTEIPAVTNLMDEYQPRVITTLNDARGLPFFDFYEDMRQLVSPDQIPRHLKDAIVAAEDDWFYQHWGLDPMGILRAFLRDIRLGRLEQGGSTITQQVAKNLFLTPRKSILRKIKEARLALELEKRYTKEEILCLYCNQIFFGYRVYGVGSASRFYFNKPVHELTLEESALLAGILPAPNAYSPFKDPDKALWRRNLTLDRMAEEGFISPEDAEVAKALPIELREGSQSAKVGRYFVELVGAELEERFGHTALREEGLNVITTLDLDLQKAAEKAVREGLRNVDKRRGYRGAPENLLEMGLEDLDSYDRSEWAAELRTGARIHGLVTEVSRDHATVRIGDRRFELRKEAVAWTGTSDLGRVLKRGDLPLFRVELTEAESGEESVTLTLDQEPLMEAALIALEVGTGEIKALVGGYDWNRSQFDCAVQARRQAGSAFKPIYYAAALENGFTFGETLFDEPVTWVDSITEEVYEPKNFYKEYEGITTLRKALEQSKNIVSVLLFEELGPGLAAEYAKQFGIESKIHPYLSSALGSSEVSLLEMVTAYSVFANHGILVRPHLIREIRDRTDKSLHRPVFEARDAIRPETAYLMCDALTGVVARGTAKSSRGRVSRVTAGKTGTTDEYTDAWFIGFTPNLVCGVWVGYAEGNQTIGRKETGAKAALPIWTDFMSIAAEYWPDRSFQPPGNLNWVTIDIHTGLLAAPQCTDVVRQPFLRGTEPYQYCSPSRHNLVIYCPYTVQKELLTDISLAQYEGSEIFPCSLTEPPTREP